MPDGVPGRTDGLRVIWIDKRLKQDERRCTLTHELIHIERGHDGCQRPCVEPHVRVETARRLITIDAPCRTSSWARSLQGPVEDLWVTTDVLADRLESLTPDETAQLSLVEHQTR
jgi:hypothetical protein